MPRKFKKELLKGLEVVDITAKGKGVVKSVEGKVIFVQDVVPGDKVTGETFKNRRGHFEARLINIDDPSPDRVAPVCEHFGVCGGCKWQNLSYEAQLKFKQKEILHNLKNLSGMVLQEIDEIKAAQQSYFYRNKMEYAFSDQRWLTADEITNKSETLDETKSRSGPPPRPKPKSNKKAPKLPPPPPPKLKKKLSPVARSAYEDDEL